MRQILREATESAHFRLHRHPVLVPLKEDSLTRSSYGLALRAFYGLHSAADRHFAPVWPDRRLRAPLIKADLTFLELSVPSESFADLPRFNTWAEFVGARYVVDGSSFGARVLFANVNKVLSMDAEHGASFLSGGSVDVAREWRELLKCLEDMENEHDRDLARRTAVDTFHAIEQWFNRFT